MSEGPDKAGVDERRVVHERPRYPIVHGVPILFGVRDPTGFSSRTNDRIQHGEFEVEVTACSSGQVDRVVQDAILGTNGNLYRHLEGRLPATRSLSSVSPRERPACCSTSEAVGAGGALQRRAPAIGRSSSIPSLAAAQLRRAGGSAVKLVRGNEHQHDAELRLRVAGCRLP
jgi:hypothetical protein